MSRAQQSFLFHSADEHFSINLMYKAFHMIIKTGVGMARSFVTWSRH